MPGLTDDTLQDLLPIYYKRLFPHYLFCKWLGYSDVQGDYFHRREFCFTLRNDIYLRYQTFNDHSEFEKELVRRVPFKIDIGGVYNQVPKDSKNWVHGVLQVEERELVFDIDMTDYDDVRSCCSSANICAKCWPLMQFAVKIIDKALEDDFGFEHRLWIYSGRRGIHCWVADEAARRLNSQARAALAEYLTVIRGGGGDTKRATINHSHPLLKRALKIIDRNFVDYACNKQDFLGDETRIAKVLTLVPQDYREEFAESMKKVETSQERWKMLQSCVSKYVDSKAKRAKISANVIDEIKFQYCYPRLDIEVTKGVNHLLKSPFCIHPKTGRVCVPIDADKVDAFDPDNVPTIDDLCGQLERYDMVSSEVTKKDYNKTTLKSYIEIFERFLARLERTWKGKNLLKSDLKGMEGDF